MSTPSESFAEIEAILEGARTPARGPAAEDPAERNNGRGEFRSVAQRHAYTHEAMIDLLLLNPAITNKEIGAYFGVSANHISFLRSSDAFQVRLSQRRDADILPQVQEEIQARMRSVANRSLELLGEKLARPAADVPDALVLKAVELGAKGVGLGGFGNAPAVPAPPAADRFEKLAERLTALVPDRKAGAVDVEAREVKGA